MTGAAMNGGAAYSPGYQLPLWLGSAQLRLWRRIDRILGGHADGETTVRAIAAATNANPGAVSRDLGRLQRLGFIARSTTRGRLGSVRLWRVVSHRLRGLDPRRRSRALGRMGAPAPGQLVLLLADGPAEPPGWWPAADPAPTPLRPLAPAPAAPRQTAPDPEPIPDRDGPYGMTRCETCGRLRLTYHGAVLGPCGHEAGR